MSASRVSADVRQQRLATVRLIAARLNEQARELAADLLPNGVMDGRHFRVGSIAGERGQSLCIDISGPTQGRWVDFSACKGMPDHSGDMLDLIRLVRFGGRKIDAIAYAKSILGMDNLDPARLATEQARASERRRAAAADAAKEAERKLRRARALFVPHKGGCVPIVDTPAEWYLAGRGIDLACLEVDGQRYTPNALAFHPAVYCGEVDAELPALIARIIDGTGQQIGTHRIWLAPDGAGGWGKAPLLNPKKALGDFKGGYIPLWKGACRKTLMAIDAGVDVHVAEGVEDGLSAAIAKPAARVIAAISLSNLGNLPIPPAIEAGDGRFVMLAQNDPAGSKAEEALARGAARLAERGATVAIARPPAGVKDWNDLIRGVAPQAVAA